jgi:type II secretory pathway component PulF
MPVFEYKGIDRKGKKTKGNIDSDSVRLARVKLKNDGIYVSEINEVGSNTNNYLEKLNNFFVAKKVPASRLAQETRQFATLINAGIPIVESLQVLGDQTPHPLMKRVFVNVREKVEDGAALNKALANFPEAFPRLYINLVASGEASGTLDSVLENLADHMERSN